MKDILKIMRFDFLTAAPASHAATEYILRAFMLIVAVCFPLFVFPAASFMYMFMAGPLIVPLQGYSEKNGFNKLYGILPVRRKNITRARFLYIFLTHFAMEIAALIILVISEYAKLFEIVSFMGKDSIFTDIEKLPEMAAIVIAWFAFLCLTYAFMEMYGQIHGRQNEMKVLFIIIIAAFFLVMCC